MEEPIPDLWRGTVAQILRHGDRNSIITTDTSDVEWSSTFPDSWHFHRFEAMALALDQPVVGRRVLDMSEPGETWAFWFWFQGRKLYGKVNLVPGGQLIIVYSSHIPRKGEESL